MTWHALDLDGPIGTTPVAAGLVDDPTRRVLLVRDEEGTLHATALACPHLGQPLTHGKVEGAVLECGHHAYRFRLEDGVCVGPSGPREVGPSGPQDDGPSGPREVGPSGPQEVGPSGPRGVGPPAVAALRVHDVREGQGGIEVRLADQADTADDRS